MKKFGFVLLISTIMLLFVMPVTVGAFPILIGIPSTISRGSIWIIAGILIIAIIAAVIIIKKAKAKKNEK